MSAQDSRKVRWSIVIFAVTLVVGSLGLVGCPVEDDDDFFGKDSVKVSQPAQSDASK